MAQGARIGSSRSEAVWLWKGKFLPSVASPHPSSSLPPFSLPHILPSFGEGPCMLSAYPTMNSTPESSF